MVEPNRNRYLSSISAELKSQATRVRDIIGDKHWLSDGHHKEYLLRYLLERHVPAGVRIARGFVAHPSRSDVISKEQDLLVLDVSATAPIFDQGGLCVALPNQVLGVVAVKTTFCPRELKDAIETVRSVESVVSAAGMAPIPWSGALFFEAGKSSPVQMSEIIGRTLRDMAHGGLARTVRIANQLVIGVVDVAGFVADPPQAEDAICSLRGFGSDGAVLLLHGLISTIARARGANESEHEQFFSGFEMNPLGDKPIPVPCC